MYFNELLKNKLATFFKEKVDKWGVKEGMKMLATSTIINVANQQNFLSQPVLATTSTSSPEINTTLKYFHIENNIHLKY